MQVGQDKGRGADVEEAAEGEDEADDVDLYTQQVRAGHNCLVGMRVTMRGGRGTYRQTQTAEGDISVRVHREKAVPREIG